MDVDLVDVDRADVDRSGVDCSGVARTVDEALALGEGGGVPMKAPSWHGAGARLEP